MPDNTQTAYLAGGCFWGMEALLRRIPGVLSTEVGYSGGSAAHVNYEIVKEGNSGHAETLKVVFDPERLSFRHLLFEFFRIHDPTTRNRQGNDVGTQYRSAIFYLDTGQRGMAEEVIETVEASGQWRAKITTEVAAFGGFHRAEEHHQNYLVQHPHGYSCHFRRSLTLGENT